MFLGGRGGRVATKWGRGLRLEQGQAPPAASERLQEVALSRDAVEAAGDPTGPRCRRGAAEHPVARDVRRRGDGGGRRAEGHGLDEGGQGREEAQAGALARTAAQALSLGRAVRRRCWRVAASRRACGGGTHIETSPCACGHAPQRPSISQLLLDSSVLRAAVPRCGAISAANRFRRHAM